MPAGGYNCQLVAMCPKTKKTSPRDVAEEADMTELFPRKGVAQVNFNKRYVDGQKRVAQCDTRVCKGAGIEDDEGDTLAARTSIETDPETAGALGVPLADPDQSQLLRTFDEIAAGIDDPPGPPESAASPVPAAAAAATAFAGAAASDLPAPAGRCRAGDRPAASPVRPAGCGYRRRRRRRRASGRRS